MLRSSVVTAFIFLCCLGSQLSAQVTASPIPGKSLFLKERVAIFTNSGVTGINPGTRVRVIRDNGATLRVTDGTSVFDVSKGKLTENSDLGAQAARSEIAAQQAAADYLRRQNEAYRKQRDADNAQFAEDLRKIEERKAQARQAQAQQATEQPNKVIIKSQSDALSQLRDLEQALQLYQQVEQLQRLSRGLPVTENESGNSSELGGLDAINDAQRRQDEEMEQARQQRRQQEVDQARQQEEEMEQARRQREEMERHEKEMYRSRANSVVWEVETRAATARVNPIRFGEKESYEGLAGNDLRRADDPMLQSRFDEALRKMDSERREQEERQRRQEDEQRQRNSDDQFSPQY